LPSLADGAVVAAAARHLRHVRMPRGAFNTLVDAFEHWAPEGSDAGWALGDAVAHAARPEHAEVLRELAQHKTYGHSLQMIRHALWRWRKIDRIEPPLRGLVTDPDVSLHAISALTRVISPSEMLAVLEGAQDDRDPAVREQVRRQLTKLRRKLGTSSA